MNNTVDRMEEEIKNNWFSDHVAKLTEYDEVSILEWKEPGTSMYSVKYIMSGNKLMISGDLGEAIFDLTWNASVGSFEDIHLGYLMGKLSCSSRGKFNFDEDLALKQLKEWAANQLYGEENDAFIEDIKEVYESIKDCIEDSSTIDSYDHAIYNYYVNTYEGELDSEIFSSFSEFGREYKSVFPAYLIGLQMANEKLKKERLNNGN